MNEVSAAEPSEGLGFEEGDEDDDDEDEDDEVAEDDDEDDEDEDDEVAEDDDEDEMKMMMMMMKLLRMMMKMMKMMMMMMKLLRMMMKMMKMMKLLRMMLFGHCFELILHLDEWGGPKFPVSPVPWCSSCTDGGLKGDGIRAKLRRRRPCGSAS